MKLKKLTLIAALAMFSLSGAANALLPMMLMMMGGGMMHGMGGHGGAAQGASPAEGHDHASGKEANGVGANAASGEHRQDSTAGTPGSVGATGTNRPSEPMMGGGMMSGGMMGGGMTQGMGGHDGSAQGASPAEEYGGK